MKKFTLFFFAVFTAFSTNFAAEVEQLSLTSGNFTDGVITWTAANGNITVQQWKGAGNAVGNYIDAPRVYRANILAFACADGCTISEIAIAYNGTNKGAGIIAGTTYNENDVTENQEAITVSLDEENGGTHTFTTTNANGESTIYIQNGTSTGTNVQLRITAISITYIQTATGDVNVTEVTLDKTEETVEAGKTVTLTPTVSPINATNKNVTWTTSDAEVATVEDGVVTGVAEGSAIITVTTEDGNFTATCAITVSPARILSKWQTTHTSAEGILTTTGGTSTSEAKVNNYDAIKAGTSKVAGAVALTIPANTTNLYLHAAGWNKETVTLDITGATTNPTALTLTANSGISNNSPFTLSGDIDADEYFFEIELSGITTETTLTLTAASDYRFVIWGVNYEIDSTPTAINNATVEQKAVKMIENGQLVIIREGVKYNAQGAVIE